MGAGADRKGQSGPARHRSFNLRALDRVAITAQGRALLEAHDALLPVRSLVAFHSALERAGFKRRGES